MDLTFLCTWSGCCLTLFSATFYRLCMITSLYTSLQLREVDFVLCELYFLLYATPGHGHFHPCKEGEGKEKQMCSLHSCIFGGIFKSGLIFFSISLPHPFPDFICKGHANLVRQRNYTPIGGYRQKRPYMEHIWSFMKTVARFLPGAQSCMFQFLTIVIP